MTPVFGQAFAKDELYLQRRRGADSVFKTPARWLIYRTNVSPKLIFLFFSPALSGASNVQVLLPRKIRSCVLSAVYGKERG